MTHAKLLLIPLLLISAVLAALGLRSRDEGSFRIETSPPSVVADGHTDILIRAAPQGATLRTAKAVVVEGQTRAEIESTKVEDGIAVVRIRPGILPGKFAVQIDAEGFASGRVELNAAILASDSWADGTPDFLRLGAQDESAFRNWFTYLAESQYQRPASALPKEIDDCAALLRFAYREALRSHDAEWANALNLDGLKALPSVRKYRYPQTPLAASLFRVREGAFQLKNLADGAFAEFADAQTLQRLNTHFVSRDVSAALPGDLLFYRQLDQNLPFHVMVFVGKSHFDVEDLPRVVYHTGPVGDAAGEIRRPALEALMRHPQPQWRPAISNGNFLGVYRWNILR